VAGSNGDEHVGGNDGLESQIVCSACDRLAALTYLCKSGTLLSAVAMHRMLVYVYVCMRQLSCTNKSNELSNHGSQLLEAVCIPILVYHFTHHKSTASILFCVCFPSCFPFPLAFLRLSPKA
jgi:hypothetical protein